MLNICCIFGSVTLRAAIDGEAVVLAVTNTGIAPANLEKLSRPFEQIGNAKGKEGTGLGLALVKALAALHGGEAIIASVLSEGTTLTVRLPHAAAWGARAEPESTVVAFRSA